MIKKPSTYFDKGAARLCLIYFLVAITWVICAASLREILKERYFTQSFDRVEFFADIFSAIGVTIILYFVIRRYNRQIFISRQKEEESNRNAEKAFQESNRYYLAILENSFDGIVLVSSEGRILYQSPSAEKILGYSSLESKDFDVLSLLPKDDLPVAAQAFEELISNPGKQIFTVAHVMHRDGSERVLEIFAKNLLHDPIVKGIVVNYRDVTEKNKAEERALHSMIEGEDRERKRIASELHDGLGQQLTAATLNFQLFIEELDQLGEEKRRQFYLGLAFLNKAIDESRNIAHNLMPMSIGDFGLVFSLETMFASVRKATGVDINFFYNIKKERFGDHIDINLYRISQEAINNVVKHSGAKQVTVQLVKHPHSLIYTFEDDGIGFDNSEDSNVRTSGMGLQNMANRVKAMSGELHIDSKPGHGTAITVELPV